jgi:hypothetical protein
VDRNSFETNGGRNDEEIIIRNIKPELNRICFNPIRASLIHLLFNSGDLDYCMSVEDMSHKLGKRHSVIIYHLEKLSKWKIVKVAKKYQYGIKERRSIWGLNSDMPTLVSEIYSYMISTFFTKKELNELCNVNKNVRKAA